MKLEWEARKDWVPNALTREGGICQSFARPPDGGWAVMVSSTFTKDSRGTDYARDTLVTDGGKDFHGCRSSLGREEVADSHN